MERQAPGLMAFAADLLSVSKGAMQLGFSDGVTEIW
jgi:hypothetical protein